MQKLSETPPTPPLQKAPQTKAAREELAATVRPILQAIAKLIATDRRAVLLANRQGDILLSNQSAQRLAIDRTQLCERLDWPALCSRVRRAGNVLVSWQQNEQSFDGEVVHIPLGPAEGYLLRLAESDQESTWLRNRARSAALMRISHDLRTPIQSLLASAHLLTQDPGNGSSQAERVSQIRRAADLALDHISNVLAVIRGEQDARAGLPDEDFRIAEELGNLVALVEPMARARATEVHLEVSAPQDLTLHGPLRFVRALCQNLIDNSVNHGGGHVALRLRCSPLASTLGQDAQSAPLWRVDLELSDEGGGLPAAQKARLAEALGQTTGQSTHAAQPAAPREAQGDAPREELRPAEAGQPDSKRPSAGLNVLGHALQQLGGRIEIFDLGTDGMPLRAQTEGRVIGTLFRVSFSLPEAPTRARSAPAQPKAPRGNSLAGRRLLLVEDSPSSRDWLVQILHSFGAEVMSAGSAPEALALLARKEIASKVDLVLTDVTLPRMSGIEFAARLKSGDPAAPSPWQGKVVGLTAHGDDRIRHACALAGMVCVLQKPIPPERLRDVLTQIFSDVPIPNDGDRGLLDETVIAKSVVEDLFERLGAQTVTNFMQRALREAQTVVDELRQDGIGPDTGRRLHAATGACGLTGLVLIERQLRAIEVAVAEDGQDYARLIPPLSEALALTRKLIADLP